MDGVIKLIAKTITKNALGYPVSEETETETFCEERSVTRAEFFGAGKAGLTPAHVFRINSAEYSGEPEVEYNGQRFKVYRTYTDSDDPDYLELYTEYASGVTDAG